MTAHEILKEIKEQVALHENYFKEKPNKIKIGFKINEILEKELIENSAYHPKLLAKIKKRRIFGIEVEVTDSENEIEMLTERLN